MGAGGDSRPEHGNEAIGAPAVISGKRGQTVVGMGVEDDDPEAEVDRRGDRGDHGGAAPGCSVAGFGAIRRLGKLEELAQKEHVSVAQPRMAHEPGEDPEAVAARVRGILSDAVTAYEQRRLRDAEESYRRRVESMRTQSRAIPTTPQRRRELFMTIMTRQPDLGTALVTLQNREFRSLTDADIQSALEQLAALGALQQFEDR